VTLTDGALLGLSVVVLLYLLAALFKPEWF